MQKTEEQVGSRSGSTSAGGGPTESENGSEVHVSSRGPSRLRRTLTQMLRHLGLRRQGGDAAEGRRRPQVEPAGGVPDEIRAAIDRVALCVGNMGRAVYGDFMAQTQVGKDACLLVAWAFKNHQRDSRFVAFLMNRHTQSKTRRDDSQIH